MKIWPPNATKPAGIYSRGMKVFEVHIIFSMPDRVCSCDHTSTCIIRAADTLYCTCFFKGLRNIPWMEQYEFSEKQSSPAQGTVFMERSRCTTGVHQAAKGTNLERILRFGPDFHESGRRTRSDTGGDGVGQPLTGFSCSCSSAVRFEAWGFRPRLRRVSDIWSAVHP